MQSYIVLQTVKAKALSYGAWTGTTRLSPSVLSLGTKCSPKSSPVPTLLV